MSDVPPPPGAAAPPRVVPPPPPPTLMSQPTSTVTPPPGYVTYGNSSTTVGSLRRVRGLSIGVIALTGIAAVTAVVSTILAAGVTQDAKDYLSGELSDNEFESAIASVSAMELASTMAMFAAFVLTTIWMYRLASNVRAFQRRTTWSPLFGIFGWMLPPGFLYVIPLLMLRELWKASDPTSPGDAESWRAGKENPLVWVWFVLYGLLPIALSVFTVGSLLNSGIPSNALESSAKSLDEFGALTVVTLLVKVAAAAVWILFVRQLTQRHAQLTNES